MKRPEHEINEFRDALERSSAPSVDLFLEQRRNFEPIGKLAIAASLISFESYDSFARNKATPQRWYEWLFGLMVEPGPFEANPLSVLTFNYDRSLEAFFLMALKNYYGHNPPAPEARLGKIRIIHLYGSLGDSRAYEPKLTPELAQIAADSIKIMHEVEPGEEFGKAKKLLRDAEEVIFLGFGFHAINVQRLDLENVAAWHRDSKGSSAQWFACRTGMGEGDVARARARLKLPGVIFGDAFPNIVEFLKNTSCLIPR